MSGAKEGKPTSHKSKLGCLIISTFIGFVGYNGFRTESLIQFTTAELMNAVAKEGAKKPNVTEEKDPYLWNGEEVKEGAKKPNVTEEKDPYFWNGEEVKEGAKEPNVTEEKDPYLWNGEEVYLNAAKEIKPLTDKVTVHAYQTMYGQYLLPYYRKNPKMKMLEIGLGCDMGYGPGASVQIYKKLFPEADLWEAEYDADCVKKAKENGMLEGFHTLVGDQGNVDVLDGWIEESGGEFDVIIDDGGHQNCQIYTSFVKLWPTVKPGGLYFIEDMQVAKMNMYKRSYSAICNKRLIFPDKTLKGFFDDLMYDTERKGDIKFMFCQSEACVLGKK